MYLLYIHDKRLGLGVVLCRKNCRVLKAMRAWCGSAIANVYSTFEIIHRRTLYLCHVGNNIKKQP